MPVRFLSDAHCDQLSGFPRELDAGLLEHFFTLSDADLAEADQRRGPPSRGWALQLCGLRMLGLFPDDVTSAPRSAVAFLARQLGADAGALANYGARPQTPRGT